MGVGQVHDVTFLSPSMFSLGIWVLVPSDNCVYLTAKSDGFSLYLSNYKVRPRTQSLLGENVNHQCQVQWFSLGGWLGIPRTSGLLVSKVSQKQVGWLVGLMN